MKLYVGNLPFSATEDELRSFFENGGYEVSEVKLITDRDTGRPRGFGFVTIPDDGQAQEAIDQLNGQDMGGRSLRINEAQERRGGGGGGGGGFRGGRGGGGGGFRGGRGGGDRY